jgi:hypothetical protein
VPSILGGQFRNQAEPLETIKRSVERSGSELHSGESSDVLDQRVAVFRTVSETRENQDRGVTGPTQHIW